jgi:hypothetical protein
MSRSKQEREDEEWRLYAIAREREAKHATFRSNHPATHHITRISEVFDPDTSAMAEAIKYLLDRAIEEDIEKS